MGFFDFLFGKKKTTLADVDAENKAFVAANPMPASMEDGRMRKASGYMAGGEFAKAVELYRELADRYPENRGLYLGQVGAAYYFMSDFDSAISYYQQARKEGADESMMDDNMWEASEEIYNAGGDGAKAAIERYLALYPSGNYVKRANKLLAK